MLNGKLIFECASGAVNVMTCPILNINDEMLHKLSCVLNYCDKCCDKYTPITYEKDCNDQIKYMLYVYMIRIWIPRVIRGYQILVLC